MSSAPSWAKEESTPTLEFVQAFQSSQKFQFWEMSGADTEEWEPKGCGPEGVEGSGRSSLAAEGPVRSSLVQSGGGGAGCCPCKKS